MSDFFLTFGLLMLSISHLFTVLMLGRMQRDIEKCSAFVDAVFEVVGDSRKDSADPEVPGDE